MPRLPLPRPFGLSARRYFARVQQNRQNLRVITPTGAAVKLFLAGATPANRGGLPAFSRGRSC